MKKKTARKILFSFVVLSVTALLNFNAASVNAAPLQQENVTLSVATPSTSSIYTVKFQTATAATLTEIDLQFATTPSGAVTNAGADLTAATVNSASVGSANGSWTATPSTGLIKVTDAANTTSVSAATSVTLTIGGIVNPAFTNCGGSSSSSSASCFIRITTINSNGTAIDNGASSFTIIADTTATATIDPSITFSISGVGTGTNSINGASTTVHPTQNSTYNTLPFGNFSANTTSDVAQALTVSTNAKNGYTVSMAMTSPMTGTYGAQYTISPFNVGTWGAPVAWTSPTTASPSSYLGAYSSDNNVAQFNNPSPATILYGPVNTTANTVMQSINPDNGRVVYVTYQLQTDVYQQADTYTGTLQYNAVAKY